MTSLNALSARSTTEKLWLSNKAASKLVKSNGTAYRARSESMRRPAKNSGGKRPHKRARVCAIITRPETASRQCKQPLLQQCNNLKDYCISAYRVWQKCKNVFFAIAALMHKPFKTGVGLTCHGGRRVRLPTLTSRGLQRMTDLKAFS